MQGPDPRDPRSQGYPCWGPLSGRNGHGRWQVCEMCRLRIQYTPVHGAKAIYRSADPLATDTARAMDKVKENVVKESSRENLNTKAIGIQGAKESLQGEHTKHHQTAPHLSARLGQLQSELARPTISTIKAYKSHQQVDLRSFQTRHLSVKINQSA